MLRLGDDVIEFGPGRVDHAYVQVRGALRRDGLVEELPHPGERLLPLLGFRPQALAVRPGQFVVGSFATSDNTCPICSEGYQSSCVRREFVSGAQAEFVRIANADGTLVPTPTTVTYEWTSDGSVVGTGATYTATASDLDAEIVVSVTLIARALIAT